MKFIILTLFSLTFGNMAKAQGLPTDFLESNLAFRAQMNAEFANPAETPLDSVGRLHFDSLDFFPINPDFCFSARFESTPNEKPLMMKKSKNKVAEYLKVGEALFVYKGNNYNLNIYRNIALSKKTGFEDYLFLPFTDATNGISTYGGGRYLDLRIPVGNEIILDFNKAYNPYCAYNHKYSCPIPPRENDLPFEINAGVKAFVENY
jgi:uncharacterized protein (DUF1684 family)